MDEDKKFELPSIDDDSVLRRRTPLSNNNNNNVNGSSDPKKTAKKTWHDHPRVKHWIRALDFWWLSQQKKRPWLKGDEYDDSRYNKRVPLKMYKTLDFINYNWTAIWTTIAATIAILLIWSVVNQMVETSVKLKLLENDAESAIRFLDMSLTEMHYPTKSKAYDEWAKHGVTKEFAPDEFANEAIVTTMFFDASSLFHQNDATLYKISLNDMHSICAERCHDPAKCSCVSLFQMGVPRNAIYVYDSVIKNYRLLFDVKVKKDIHAAYHKVEWNMNEKTNDAVLIDVPFQLLITYKEQSQEGKISTRQYANEFAACIFLQLQLQNNYTALLDVVAHAKSSPENKQP